MASAKSGAVAKTDEAGLPATFDYGEHAGGGFEGMTVRDLAVPFLAVLQGLSKVVTDNDPEGARAGMLFNTVTRELIDGDEGVVVIPCHRETFWVEWRLRDDGGGLVGRHELESEVVAAAKKKANADFGALPWTAEVDGKKVDTELVETLYVYCLILDAEAEEVEGFAVFSFTSTKLKPSRAWLTAMKMQKGKPPIYAHRAKIRTIKETRDAGTSYNVRVDPIGGSWRAAQIDPSGSLFAEAVEFRDSVKSGQRTAAFETERAAGDSGGEEAGDVPF